MNCLAFKNSELRSTDLECFDHLKTQTFGVWNNIEHSKAEFVQYSDPYFTTKYQITLE
jgi:hypothetical protein